MPVEPDELTMMPREAVESLDAMLVFSVLRTHSYLAPHIGRQLRETNLTGAKLNALLVLSAAGDEGLPLSEVGRRLVVTKANVTGLIDRLEAMGLVCRQGSSDRRVTAARLTEQGRALLTDILPTQERLFGSIADCLEETEKRHLIELLYKLRRGLREKGARASCR